MSGFEDEFDMFYGGAYKPKPKKPCSAKTKAKFLARNPDSHNPECDPARGRFARWHDAEMIKAHREAKKPELAKKLKAKRVAAWNAKMANPLEVPCHQQVMHELVKGKIIPGTNMKAEYERVRKTITQCKERKPKVLKGNQDPKLALYQRHLKAWRATKPGQVFRKGEANALFKADAVAYGAYLEEKKTLPAAPAAPASPSGELPSSYYFY